MHDLSFCVWSWTSFSYNTLPSPYYSPSLMHFAYLASSTRLVQKVPHFCEDLRCFAWTSFAWKESKAGDIVHSFVLNSELLFLALSLFCCTRLAFMNIWRMENIVPCIPSSNQSGFDPALFVCFFVFLRNDSIFPPIDLIVAFSLKQILFVIYFFYFEISNHPINSNSIIFPSIIKIKFKGL